MDRKVVCMAGVSYRKDGEEDHLYSLVVSAAETKEGYEFCLKMHKPKSKNDGVRRCVSIEREKPEFTECDISRGKEKDTLEIVLRDGESVVASAKVKMRQDLASLSVEGEQNNEATIKTSEIV